MLWIYLIGGTLLAGYLARRWRTSRGLQQLRAVRTHWREIDAVWRDTAQLNQHLWNPDLRNSIAHLQRHNITALAERVGADPKLGPEQARVRQFVRGSFRPKPGPSSAADAELIAAASRMQDRMQQRLATQPSPDATMIRAAAALQQLEARARVSRLASQAVRQRISGKRRDALKSIDQARQWLRYLPQGQADALLEKFGAEQALLQRR